MMKGKYRIMLVDDHSLFRESLKFVLMQQDNIDIVAEASDGIQCIEMLDKMKPDLILMDISMPRLNGVETTKEVLKKNPDLKIIALSMFGDEEYYYKMLQAGAKGFVLKESGSDELLKAITNVMNGEVYYSNKVLSNLIRNFYPAQNDNSRCDQNCTLSGREIEVLKLICEGFSNSEIADRICISQRTVEGHRSNIMQKTGAKNSIHLVLLALQKMIIAL